MNDCYYAKRDWRACSKEVCLFLSSVSEGDVFILLLCSPEGHRATQLRPAEGSSPAGTLDLRLRCLSLRRFWLLTVMLTAVFVYRCRPSGSAGSATATTSEPRLAMLRPVSSSCTGYILSSLCSLLSGLYSISLFLSSYCLYYYYQYQPIDHGISSFFSSASNANLNASQKGH